MYFFVVWLFSWRDKLFNKNMYYFLLPRLNGDRSFDFFFFVCCSVGEASPSFCCSTPPSSSSTFFSFSFSRRFSIASATRRARSLEFLVFIVAFATSSFRCSRRHCVVVPLRVVVAVVVVVVVVYARALRTCRTA